MDKNSAEVIDIRFLLSGLLVWFVSALILMPAAALAAELAMCSERGLTYISSGLSFAAGLAAGAKAIRVRKKNAVFTALITGVCIIIIALTLGFIVASEKLQPDGILSVVSFSLAGCLVGAVFFQKRKQQGRGMTLNNKRPKG